MDNKLQLQNLFYKFKKDFEDYISKDYLEANVRHEFIDPFFEYIGWDISNRSGNRPNLREVIVEDKIGSKRVDYTFRVGGKPVFLVEAKAPSESLDKEEHVFQAKSYAFSSGVPFVILTNFLEFKVFDIRVKPYKNQKNVDLLANLSFSIDNIDNLENFCKIFAKNYVINNSLIELYKLNRPNLTDEEILNNLNYANLKGESTLDKEFLKDLLYWREILAKDIYSNNPDISEDDLNIYVQKILDKILFLRILEDREIENNEILREICLKYYNHSINDIYKELNSICKDLNEKYNGLLFKQYNELASLNISNEVLYSVINQTYVPESPYNFAEISIDILGIIFEQYLGKVIEIKDNNVVITLKKENLRSGGVYYTPQYIVDEITRYALDKKLEEVHSFEELKNIKVADIACGSGSFLVSAYRYLIYYYENNLFNYFHEEYLLLNNIIFKNNDSYLLTMKTKKEILESSIFGGDIDNQATEITKMNLYLTMLEQNYIDESTRPILPSLETNIYCGNSVINTDYPNLPETISTIKPFNINRFFSDKKLDCIIGNPPYIRIQTLEEVYGSTYVEYLKNKYKLQGNFDESVVFILNAIKLLKSDGILGYIVLNKFFKTGYGQTIRKELTDKGYLYRIFDFKDQQVFKGVTTYTCLLYLRNCYNNTFEYSDPKLIDIQNNSQIDVKIKNISEYSGNPWHFDEQLKILEEKITPTSIPLKDIVPNNGIYVGLQTNGDDIFLLNLIDYNQENQTYNCYSKYKNCSYPFEANHIKTILKGSRDIHRYRCDYNRKVIIPYNTETAEIIAEDTYDNNFHMTYEYLKSCKQFLSEREKIIAENLPWYGYVYKKNITKFSGEKIFCPSLCNGSRFAIGEHNVFSTCSGQGGGGAYAIKIRENSIYDYYSLLGVLNSCIVSYFIKNKGTPQSGGYQGVDKKFLENILIPKITIDDRDKIEILHKIGKYAKDITDIYKTKYNQINSDTNIANELTDELSDNIDDLVSELYELDDNDLNMIKSEITE